MRGRLAVAANLLKAWLLFVVPALAMGFAGWRLGGYRLGLLFLGSVVLLAAALYWYADRIAMGMVGARELLPGEAPALHSAVETLSGRAAVIRPRLYLLADGYPRALLFVLGPLAASFVHLLLSPKREYEADRFAAELCGSPHGLADALLRLEASMELVAFEASPATEPLYTTNPFAEEGLATLFITHPPVGERVRRLRALDPEWREKLRAA